MLTNQEDNTREAFITLTISYRCCFPVSFWVIRLIVNVPQLFNHLMKGHRNTKLLRKVDGE